MCYLRYIYIQVVLLFHCLKIDYSISDKFDDWECICYFCWLCWAWLAVTVQGIQSFKPGTKNCWSWELLRALRYIHCIIFSYLWIKQVLLKVKSIRSDQGPGRFSRVGSRSGFFSYEFDQVFLDALIRFFLSRDWLLIRITQTGFCKK